MRQLRAPEFQLPQLRELRPMMWPADSPLLSMWELSSDTTAARQARLAIRAWLSGLRIDPTGETGADVVMVASELAANAVVHGQPPVWLSARVDLGSGYVPAIVITVTDGGGADVSPPVSAPDSENGRGLAIVAALADWTDTEKTWNATQVRAGFALPDLTVPSPRNTPSGTVRGGTRPGCPPHASLSALI